MSISKQRRKIRSNILIGPLPPPTYGQSISFQMLCEGFSERHIPFRVIDISSPSSDRIDGAFSVNRFIGYLRPFLKALAFPFLPHRTIYLTIAQSWFGFLRDCVFILCGSLGRHRIVVHLKGGNYHHFYESLSPIRQNIVCLVLARVDKILILGHSLKGMFDFSSKIEKKIEVVYNGLPYHQEEVRYRYREIPFNKKDRLKILFLSNLIVSKGYLLVLEALRILLYERGIDAEGHFCGQFAIAPDVCPYESVEEAENDFIMKIRELGLENNVTWHGPVDGERKKAFLQTCHFFVLPTSYLNEGQPVSIIEALAFGLVVIATPHRSIPEMLDGGKAGELVPFDNPLAIAQVIQTYSEDPSKFHSMSSGAFQRYKEAFTRDKHLDCLISHIVNN
jgi:glycosyltransferase involved in cell wall biosynthesis